eukprot:232607-Prymnesium_polylepis.1
MQDGIFPGRGGHALARLALCVVKGTPLYERVRGRWFRVRGGALSCAVGCGSGVRVCVTRCIYNVAPKKSGHGRCRHRS